MADNNTETTQPPPKKSGLTRLIPLAVLVAVIAAFFASGLHHQVSFDAIALRYGELSTLVGEHPVLSGFAATGIYTVATAISFPAAWLITVTIGLVFGWMPGGIYVTVGATVGACILFAAARFALAEFFRARAGGVLNRMAKGFRQDATSYMLFLRLAPVFPFTLVNVVPAILGVPFITFAWTTFVGIIPGVIAYSFAGEGLRSIVSQRAEACAANIAPCGEALTPGDLVTPQILIAFALLGGVSLIPVAIKLVRRISSDKPV